MRRHWVRSVSFSLILVCVLQAMALAESVEGRVVQTGPRSVDMVVYDAQGRPYPNALHLTVDRNTQLAGFTSLSQLRSNDALGAQVHQEESRLWHADSLTRFQEVNAQPATPKPSPSLKSALGNPVVRGALVGAATGAIAASASHGKAGKGALVGAGVGAAAGLLEGLFSSRSQSSSNSSDNNNQ